MVATLAPYDASFAHDQRMRAARMAGDQPMDLLQRGMDAAAGVGGDIAARAKRLNTWGPRKIALGGGGLALGGLMAALGELNNEDPTVTNEQRVGGAVGAGGGSVLGGLGGAALAGFLGGGPIGALVLGSLAAAAGGAAGGGLGRGLVGAFGPSPQDKELQRQLRAAQMQTDAEKYRLQTLMPLQQDIAKAAIANQVEMAAAMTPIEAQRQRNAALAQSLLEAQRSSSAQALASANAIYGTVI